MKLSFSLLMMPLLAIFISCKKNELEFKPEPRPEFSVSNRVIQPGDSIVFTNLSKGEIDTYSWSFEGAETTFSDKKDPPSIKYSRPGRFKVSLTASGPNGANTIEKTEFIVVNALDFKVEWKSDSVVMGGVFVRGRIIGFKNSTLYRTIAVVFDFDDPNPGLYSYGTYVYPNSRGEFSEGLEIMQKDFYYRLIAISGNNDVYFSDVRKVTYPKIELVMEKFEKEGAGLRVKGKVLNATSTPFVRLSGNFFPSLPMTSTYYSQPIMNNNGVFDQLVYSNYTIFKSNFQVVGSSPENAPALSTMYTTTIPESFELANFDQFSTINWNSFNFERVNGFARSGLFALASESFYGSSFGESRDASISATFPSSGNFKFWIRQSGLTAASKVELSVDGVLQALAGIPDNAFKEFTVPITPGSHTIRWRITKYSGDSFSSRILLDDLIFEE